MTAVLVTGATGQDGSYLVERLADEQCDIHCVVQPDDQRGVDDLVSRFEKLTIHEVDLVRPDDIMDLVERVEPDEIYNLGGLSSVAASWSEPMLASQVTGLAVVGLLEGARRVQQRRNRPVRMLQAGSAEIFGGSEQSLQNEATAIKPRSPYGAAKTFAHHMVVTYRARDIHAVNVILFNHESPRRPPSFVTRKITSTVAAIARGRATELVLGNLDVRRDWGWAPDYVQAMTLALRHPVPEDFVIATGESHSVRDFVAAAFSHAGVEDWEPLVRSDPAFTRPRDAVEFVGDSSKAHELLGWSPTVGFGELVGRMVDHDLSLLGRPSAQRG